MTKVCICVSMQLLKGSEYSRIPSMTGFCICKSCTQDSEYACIWLNMVVELEHFDKHFVKTKNKRVSAGKHFEVFSPRYS